MSHEPSTTMPKVELKMANDVTSPKDQAASSSSKPPVYKLAPPKKLKKAGAFAGIRDSLSLKFQQAYMKDRKLKILPLFIFHKYLEEGKGYDPAAVTLAEPWDAPDQPAGTDNFRDVSGHNNLKEAPLTGVRGQVFNHSYPPNKVPPSVTKYGLMDPDPKLVSRELLQRTNGPKVTSSVNTFCGAWIQFMTHDWMDHAKDQEKTPLWPAEGEQAAVFPSKVAMETDGFPYHFNDNCHWWQGTQIYGKTLEIQNRLRTMEGGHVKVFPQDPETGGDLVGAGSPNLWWGLTLLHILFTKEHNAIADMLRAKHHDWNDERLFQMARLINTGAIARIHVLEWTKAILDNRIAGDGQNLLWKGLLPFGVPRWVRQVICCGDARGGLVTGDDLFGKAGRPKANQHDAPFSHTEEFAHIYRMHPLMPDHFEIYDHETNRLLENLPLEDAVFAKSHRFVSKYQDKWDSLAFSMGRGPVGLLELNNYPAVLGSNGKFDMGMIDILRGREHRVPRFNDFRRVFGLPPYSSIEELAGHSDACAKIREVYGDDIEKVDLMVGTLVEQKTQGFIFSQTVYALFIHQTQRRIECDRFLTEDLTAATYTKEGLNWVQTASFRDVLNRHFPSLKNHISPKNAFFNWGRTER